MLRRWNVVTKNVLLLLKKHKQFLQAAVVITAGLFVLSCQSIPQRPEMESTVQLLPESSDVVIRVNVEQNRELIEPVMVALGGGVPDNLAEDFIDRTDTVWAGLDFTTDEESSTTFKSSIVAVGDYPKGLIDWGLCWDSSWSKAESGIMKYWAEDDGDNQLALPTDKYLLASSGCIDEMLGAWVERRTTPVNAYWLESEESADITVMTRNLTPEDYGMFIPELTRVPIESLVLSLTRVEDDYLISGRFQMSNAVSALLFATLFRTMIVAAKNDSGERVFEDRREIKIQNIKNDVLLEGMKLPVEAVADTELKWLFATGLQN